MSPLVVIECIKYTVAWVDLFKANPGHVTVVRSVNNSAIDPVRILRGRAAECGLCLYLGLDPMQALSWKVAMGYVNTLFRDLEVNGITIDAKGTHGGAEYFITSHKGYLHEPPPRDPRGNRKADILVMVKIEGVPSKLEGDWPAQLSVNDWSYKCQGWIRRRQYATTRLIKAEGDGIPIPIVGTPYLHQERLESMPDLHKVLYPEAPKPGTGVHGTLGL
jgi:hypothetical protein